MADQDLLSTINKKDLSTFKKDFFQLMKAAYGMKDSYQRGDPLASKYMPKYKSLIRSFNKKYPNLRLKLVESQELILKIFLKTTKPLKDIFMECVSKISGLKSIGSRNFGAAEISESDKFYQELEKAKKELYVTYHSEDKESDTLVLSVKNKTVELEYEIIEVLKHTHSNFKLCAYFALKDGLDSKVKIYEKASMFGFISLLQDDELKNILDKFNPFLNE